MFSRMFSSDGNNASVLAHGQIVLAIIKNVRNALLAVIEDLFRGSRCAFPGPPTFSSSFLDLPAPVFSMNAPAANRTPLCFTRITPDVSRTMARASLTVKQVRSAGFQRIDNLPIINGLSSKQPPGHYFLNRWIWRMGGALIRYCHLRVV